MKKIALISCVLALMTACAAPVMQTVHPFGRFSQMHFNEQLFVEIEFTSAEECSRESNSPNQFDEQSKKALAAGVARISCTGSSSSAILQFAGKMTNVLTGQAYPLRTRSEEACKQFLNASATKSDLLRITC